MPVARIANRRFNTNDQEYARCHFETLLYDTAGPTATITLNRPDRLTTIVPPMPDEFETAVREATLNPEVKVIVLRGVRSAPATTSPAAFITGTKL
jgi:1,4-dihydroxy-2-naphthoyl-CoA synthase